MKISEAVKFYRDLGFAILPAVYGEKRPSVEWKKYQQKAPTKAEIKEWFKDDRQQNIAILCGVPSANLVVLDFDDISIYPQFFDDQALEKETLVARTGSGKVHVYLRSDKPIASFKIPQLKLEVRSNGNVVIAPPSKHPSGGFYDFVDQNVKRVMEVTDLVNAIWNKAEKLGVKTPTDLFMEDLHERGEQPYEGPDPPCVVALSKGVEEGVRNEAAMRLASYWLKFKQDVDSAKILRRLKKWNILNRPRLSESELKAIMESVQKLDRSYGCRVNQSWCNLDQCTLLRNKLLRKQAEEEAEKILGSPNTLEALEPHLDNISAGEDDNKKLVYILLHSGKLEDPTLKQMILLKSEPGAGKSHLMRIADAFKTKSVGRFTAHALDYSNLEDYEVLRLKELGSMDQEFQGVSTVKFLSADDRGYTIEVTERDERGRFTTKQYKVPPITILTSTTRVELDPQFERRAWILNPDESREQTERIRKWKAKLERERGLVALGLLKETSYDRSMRVLRAVAKKVQPHQPILLFPGSLTRLLKSDKLRLRGDFDKIMGLVKLHALLESRKMPKAEGKNGCKVVFVTPQSAFTALKIALKPFVTMTTELEERSRKLLEILEDLRYSEAGDVIDHETRGKIAVKIGRSDRTVYRYFREWCSAGYMSMTKGTSKSNPTTFKLLYDLDFIRQKGAVILDISNASTKLGLDMENEIESCLDSIVDKITFTDGWTLNKVKEALMFPSEIEKRPTVNPILSRMPMGKKPSLTETTDKEKVLASEMSRIERLNSEKKASPTVSVKDDSHLVREKPDLGSLLSKQALENRLIQKSPTISKEKLKTKATSESEILPKSLRVPPGLEDYMTTEKMGKREVIRCLLCARQGKRFYTVNVRDMTLHIQRIHQRLLPLISEAKKRRKKETEPKENTPCSGSVKFHEWEDFHAVGPRATSEKSWKKTVQAVEAFHREEGRLPTRVELKRALTLYWKPEFIPKVLERLEAQGLVKPDGAPERISGTSVTTVTDIEVLERLEPPEHGICQLCNRRKEKNWHIKTPEGWMPICDSCAAHELVFKVMRELTRNKPYATTNELLSETKLSKEVLLEILDNFQREGKLTQLRPNFWRLT